MTKEIHQQQSQPLHAAIVGLALFLGWLVASQLFVAPEFLGQEPIHWFHHFYVLLFKQLVFWKLFTLIALIFGIRAYIFSETESTERLFYIRSLIWIVLATVLFLINMITVSIIPLIVFGIVLFRFKNSGQAIHFAGFGILLFILVLVEWCKGFPNSQSLCFSGFLSSDTSLSRCQILKGQIQDTSNQLAWIFGFMVMIIGYAIGKAKWLLDYHFYYSGLRRLFIISIGLLIIWGLLNYFNFYHFLSNYKIGSVFYMLDTLSVHLITIFVYLFILIYLENFKIGIFLLRILVQTGKLWVFNVLILFGLIFIGTSFKLVFSEGVSIILALVGFSFTSVMSYFVFPHLPKKLDIIY